MRTLVVAFICCTAAGAGTVPKTFRMPFEKPVIVQKQPGALMQKALASIPQACFQMPILRPPANISRMPVLKPEADISRMPVLAPPPSCDEK